jgi:hypothetical protein
MRALLRSSGLPDRSIEESRRDHSSDDRRRQAYPDTLEIVRGLARLLTTPLDRSRWHDGTPARIAVLVEPVEHIVPASNQGAPSESQLAVSELVALLSSDLAMQKSGNLLLLHGRAALASELVTQSVPPMRLSQPGIDMKQTFIAALRARYPDVQLETGLNWEEVAHLVSGTPNAGLEAKAYAASRRGCALSARDLTEQKTRDVTAMSEGSLSLLDPSQVDNAELVGRNVQVPARELARIAASLAAGDKRTPLNVLLVGPPGVGKSVLARLTAQVAKAAAFRMNSPKRPWVGETERIVRLQMDILKEFAPTVAFVDEVTEALPVGSLDMNTDSGASQAVQGTLLDALSDESRRGKVLTIGTTNRANAMEHRMRSRWLILPVLQPLRDDLPEIIAALACRAAGDPSVVLEREALEEAARLLFEKGANPRTIYDALARAALGKQAFTADDLLGAARTYLPEWDASSPAYGDLWAVAHAKDETFLPWHGDPSYTFPAHLAEVVDSSGKIDRKALASALERWKPDGGN